MKCNPNDSNRLTSPLHIDYVGQGRQEKLDFSNTISFELAIRNLDAVRLVSVRKERLRKVLLAQEEYRSLNIIINRYE